MSQDDVWNFARNHWGDTWNFARNHWGDTIKVDEKTVYITTVELARGWTDWIGGPMHWDESAIDDGSWRYNLETTRQAYQRQNGLGVKRINNKDIRNVKFVIAENYDEVGFIKINSGPGIYIFFEGKDAKWWPIAQHLGKTAALNAEKNLDENRAIKIFEEFSFPDEAKRIRQKIQDKGKVKVNRTVVHGDYIDDRDTIVKDSVISKSSIGPGGKSKAEELREAKALLDDGIIDDDEFKQMKKEILGK